MHVQGVVERREDGEWVGVADLPHLPPGACPSVFGQPAAETAGSGDDREAVAAARGLPDDGSDLLDRRYFQDAATVHGDAGPWRHAFGETWATAGELPDRLWRDDDSTSLEGGHSSGSP